MVLLYPIKLSNLSKAEIGQLVTSLITDYDDSQFSVRDDRLLELFSTVRQTLVGYNQSQEQVSDTKHITNLSQFDDRRDTDLNALLSAIKPFAGSPDAEEVKSYTALNTLFKDYRAVSRLNHEAETAEINHLLQKLKEPSVSQHLTYLGLDRFVTRLENSQAAFEKAYKTRAQGKLSQSVYNYRELRQNLLEDYTDICNYIDLLARRDKKVDYQPLLAIVNRSRKDFADIINKRKGRKNAKDRQELSSSSEDEFPNT